MVGAKTLASLIYTKKFCYKSSEEYYYRNTYIELYMNYLEYPRNRHERGILCVNDCNISI